MKCELKRSIIKLIPTSSDRPMVDSCEVLTGMQSIPKVIMIYSLEQITTIKYNFLVL